MNATRVVAGGLVAVLISVGVACSDGDVAGDLATFCERYRDLADNNPFEPLDVASPGEMRTAFGELRDAAVALDDAAPDDLDRLTGDFLDSVDALTDELDVAEFDPRLLDTTAYRRATIDYEAAATALSNEARANCV